MAKRIVLMGDRAIKTNWISKEYYHPGPLKWSYNEFFDAKKGGFPDMARAKRHYIPGYIWHITHRCHKREFLLKSLKDRHRYLQWLYKARKRYGLTILNYMVTSNHIHLLVIDDGDRDVIPN